jgi:hypothetical protein
MSRHLSGLASGIGMPVPLGSSRLSPTTSQTFTALRTSATLGTMGAAVRAGVGSSTYIAGGGRGPAPTLDEMKHEFQARRVAKAVKLWQVMMQVDPHLDESRAKELAEKYSV